MIESLRATTQNNDAIAIRYKKTEDNLEWITSIVYSEQPSSNWVGIRITCDSVLPASKLPEVKKPLLIRILLQKLGGGPDGQLDVTHLPIFLKDLDIDFAASCILGNAETYLPIVYSSTQFHGGYLVDNVKLARELSGMAHVVVEPHRIFSMKLMEKVSSQNVYGGTVGIYWPEGSGRRSFFIGRELESAEDVEKAIFEEIRSALNNRRPLPRCTWANIKENQSRHIISRLKNAGSTEFDKYISAFDDELSAKAIQLQDAEKEIERLKAGIRKYEAQSPTNAGLSLKTGQERDLFPGKLLDIARQALLTLPITQQRTVVGNMY